MLEQMYYDSNSVDFFIYKSMRKNSKVIDLVNCIHLIGHNEIISDDRILDYFVSKLDTIINKCMQTDGIYISFYEIYCRPTEYRNTKCEMYERNYKFEVHHNKENFVTIEQFINEMYRLFMDIYPYSKLDIKSIYENWSVKHIISNYYNHH